MPAPPHSAVMKTRTTLLALALLLPAATALAQDVVSNLDNASTAQIALSTVGASAAQAFTTGPEARKLDRIVVRLRGFQAGPHTARVKLWTGSGTLPVTLVEDLGTVPNIPSGNDGEMTVLSTTNPDLAPNTRHWVSVTVSAGDFDWRNTSEPASTGTGTFFQARATSTTGNAGTWTVPGFGGSANFQLMEVRPVVPQTFTVTTTADSGGGSLRQAVADANANPGADIIVFDPTTLDGETITLATGHLLLTDDITIDASALPGGISISGNADDNGTLDPGESRIFEVATGKVVVLRALRLVKGQVSTTAGDNSGQGGAIQTRGNLTLDRCLVADSRARFGGGIDITGGTLTITQSTLSGNSASEGGGMFVSGGSVEITQSTLSGNSAISGGGIFSDSGSSLTITRSIVAGNLTGGDINGSFTDNGSNLTSGDPLLAPLGDYGGPTPTMPPLPGSPAIDAGGSTTEATDQRGFPRVAGAAVDIGAVEAQAIPGFDPAVVTSLTDTFDGLPNGVSLREAVAFSPAGGTITFDPAEFDGQTITLGGSQILLDKDVTIDASALSAGITISGNNESRIFRVNGSGGSPSVSLRGLTLTGGNTFGDGGAIFNSAATLTLERCTLHGNTVSIGNFGGAIFSDGSGPSLTLSHCTITNNSAPGIFGLGGAIFATGSLTLRHCTITANTSGSSGGGVNFSAGDFTLDNSIVAGNTGFGGFDDDISHGGITTLTRVGTSIVQVQAGSATFAGSGTLLTAAPKLAPLGDYGGPTQTMPPLPGSPAIDAGGSTTETTDQRGFARVVGAAVDIGAVEAQAIPGFDPAVVTSLTDTFDGLPNGVSLREAAAFSPPGTTLTFDPALDGGTITLGGVHILLDKNVTIDASALPGGITISGNNESRIFRVNGSGGSPSVSLRGLTLTGGNAPDGGAIFNTSATLALEICTLHGNTTSFDGGAIKSSGPGASLTLTHCTLTGNTATNNFSLGGAIAGFANSGTASFSLRHCTVTDNTAGSSGGGVEVGGTGTLTLENSIVAGNTATINISSGDILIQGSAELTRVGANLVQNLAKFDSSTDSGPAANPAAPLLAPLGDYGGPTQTMPPLPGSPAIDAGGAAASAFPTDQRGFPRVVGAAVDIGAVEFDLDIDSGLPGTLAFGSALTTVLEEAGAGMVPVVRTGGITGSVSVTVNSAPGTATAADFTAVSGLVLTFAEGERQKLVPVTVLADTLKEPTELFTLTLSAPNGGAALGTPNPGIVRIIDSALDKAKPALSLLTPKNNEIILEAAGNVVALTGSAKDNIGIERVEISLDGGDFQPAALTHAADFKSCTFALPLTVTPGLRTVLVRAVDVRGLLSAPVKRAFTFRVVRQLAVNVSGPPGSGTVTKGFEPNSQRFVGIPHTITAAPKPGFVFTGWTANDFTGTGVTTAARELPKLAFLMREGLVLTANFLANPFTPQITGIHSGLALPDAGTTPGAGTVGLFTATVTGTGAFTGSLMLDGAKLPVSGLFTHQGQSRFGKTRSPALVLLRKGKPALTIALALDMSGATGRITGTVTQEGGATSGITADHAHYSSKSPADPALAGAKGQRYNLILPAKAQAPARALNLYPQGTGIGGMIVKPDGKVSFTLLLADGTKLTAAAALSKNDDCPLFAQLYGKLGLLAAQVTLDPAQPATDATGPDSVWFRPAQPKATSYRLGWPQGVSVDLFGSQFHIPPAAPPASVFPGLGAVDLINGNAALTFTGGLLVISPSTLGLNIDPANKVTNAPAADKTFTAALTKTTGEWKGTFTHSDGKKPAWQAATFQKAGAHQGGHGFFLSLPAKPADGLAESGRVGIQAK